MIKVYGAVDATIKNPELIVLLHERVDMLVNVGGEDVLLVDEVWILVSSRKGWPAAILRFVVQYVFRHGRKRALAQQVRSKMIVVV